MELHATSALFWSDPTLLQSGWANLRRRLVGWTAVQSSSATQAIQPLVNIVTQMPRASSNTAVTIRVMLASAYGLQSEITLPSSKIFTNRHRYVV